MQLKRLSIAEMLALSEPWITAGGPAHKALSAVPEVVGLLPRAATAHAGLLKTQRREDPRVATLIEEAVELDSEHDDLARGIDSLCVMMGHLAETAAQRKGWGRLREALFPDGLAIINQSYTAEAGNAVRVAKRIEGLGAEDRQFLKDVTLGKKTAQAVVSSWLKIGTRLGELDRERQGLQGTGATPAEIQAARQDWMRITNALVALAEMSGRADELAPYLRTPLVEAERRAARRGRGGKDKEEPAEPKPDPGPPGPTPA